MAPSKEQHEHMRTGITGDYDATQDVLLDRMANLAIAICNWESAVALPPSWGDYAAGAPALDRFALAFLEPYRGQEAGPSAHPPVRMPLPLPLPPHNRGVSDMRRFAEGRPRRSGLARGPLNEPSVGILQPCADVIAATGGALPSGHSYTAAVVAPPPPPPYGMLAVNQQWEDANLFFTGNEETFLLALSEKTPESIVSYASDLLQSRHGQWLFHLVFNHCNQQLQEWIVATITRNRKSFSSLCTGWPDDVVKIISSCRTWKSMHLFGNAMKPWMSHNQMRYLLSDSKRIKVLQAFIERSPLDIAQFIFEGVAKNCTRLACQPHGLSLLQNCLRRVCRRQKDDIFTQISYQSLFLAQNSCGNWIVQDVLKNGNPSHFGVIASCLRNHYVSLAKNKCSSNVVELCLKVFHEGERSVIVYEFISYPHFRDLATDEFANFALSTALETCKLPLRNILAKAILSQNIILRNQHCTKIFSTLTKYGYMQQNLFRDF